MPWPLIKQIAGNNLKCSRDFSVIKNIKLWVRAVQVRIFLFYDSIIYYLLCNVNNFLRFFLYYNCDIKKHKIPLKALNGAVISGISSWQFTTKLHQNITMYFRTYVQILIIHGYNMIQYDIVYQKLLTYISTYTYYI